MIFKNYLVIGEVCIISNFYFFFKNWVNFYIAQNRLDLIVSLPRGKVTGVIKIISCKVFIVTTWVGEALILIYLLVLLLFVLLREPFYAMFWGSNKLVPPQDPPPFSNPTSLKPTRLFLFVLGVIFHISSQLTSKPK